MNEEQQQKRLANLAKARQRIIELREEKEKLNKSKSKDDVPKVDKEVVVEPQEVEKETPVVADTVDKTPDVKQEVKEEVQVVKPKKKVYVKKERVKKEIVEPTMVIQNSPVKLTFERGNDGFWYM